MRVFSRSTLWLFCLSLIGFCAAADAATVSGRVVIPAAPTGSQPSLSGMTVRVEGTTLSGTVDSGTGDFSIADVPTGDVTLLLVENGEDFFTAASKRSTVTVSEGGVSGVSFNLVYHWQELTGYPAVWRQSGYDEWTPFFCSDQVGFIFFHISANPERMELYRTTDGGASGTEIGHWTMNQAQYDANVIRFPARNRSFFFADANHGAVLATAHCLPCSDCGAGFFITHDGGASWSFASLPLTDTAYAVTIHRYAKINGTHWIAGGTIGCAVQGYGSGFHDAIWETANAGTTWQLVESWEHSYGECSALGANGDGDAVAFHTPYNGSERRVSVRSGATGTWDTIDSTDIVTNSGYGPADLPMIGDTAWVANAGGNLEAGLYHSTNAGAIGTWTRISSVAVQYMSFGSEQKGFGLFGGEARISYDGGETWLRQSGGGGLCCHGNNIWAFDATHAIWQDLGVGDPNGVSDVFTYSEPWEANFEVVPGATLPDACARAGDVRVPLASFQFISHGPVPIEIASITLHAVGTGDDVADVVHVRAWLDANASGYVDADETLISEATYTADNGIATLPLDQTGAFVLQQEVPIHIVVTYDLNAATPEGRTFTCEMTAADVTAATQNPQTPIAPTAPGGHTLNGRAVTICTPILDAASGMSGWTGSTDDPQPDDGYGWRDQANAAWSWGVGAGIVENRNHEGWDKNHYLTLASPLDLSQPGEYELSFYQEYALEPSIALWVESSTDGGTTWSEIGSYGSTGAWEGHSTNGVFQQQVRDLSTYAGQAAVLLRFRFDWTSGWYFNGAWYIDDVRVFRVPENAGETPNDDGTDQTNGSDDGSETDDDEVVDASPDTPPAAPRGGLCGLGTVPATVLMMIGLVAMNRRSPRK